MTYQVQYTDPRIGTVVMHNGNPKRFERKLDKAVESGLIVKWERKGAS